MATTLDGVKECLEKAARISPDQVNEQSSLESLGLDSLDLVELAMELEDYFDCRVADEAAEQFKTLGDIVRHIDQQLAAEAAKE